MVQSVGISKVKAAHRGDLPHASHGKATDMTNELSFQIQGQDGIKPTFNVLYVQTPRIGIMQAPLFRAFAETCQEAVDLVRPILRFGVPESTLHDKCPYYECVGGWVVGSVAGWVAGSVAGGG